MNIGIIIVIIAAFIVIKKLFDLIFTRCLLPIAEKYGGKIGDKIQKRSIVSVIEVFVLLLIVFFVAVHLTLYILTDGEGMFFLYWAIMMFFFVASILILSAVIQQYKMKNPEYTSQLGRRIKELDISNKLKDNYISNRLGLFMEQTPDFFKSLVVLQVSLTCLVTLKWDANFYFLSVCFMPLYANYWVYYVRVLTVNTNSEGVFIRRSFMYLCLVTVVVFELYQKFQGYLNEEPYSPSINTFLLTGSGVFYIALDRILKDFTNDYVKFKKDLAKKKEKVDKVENWSI